MPRQRKPQSGATRLWTGRVANTTTGSTTTQAVYRIPTGKKYGECDVLNYEVVWTSPVRVAIEWSNVYRVSLDEAALKNIIENYDGLDLSNVTLQTINGDVTFTGNIAADWTFTWTSISASTVEATTWNITNVTSNSVTTGSLTTDNASLGTATATGLSTETLNVSWTSTLAWAVSAGSDLSVAWDVTITWDASAASITAISWNITSLEATSASIWTLDVTNWATITGGLASDTLETSWAASIGGNLAVTGNTEITWTSNFVGAVTADDLTATWDTSLNNVVVAGNETVAGTLWVAWATTLNNTLTVAGASTLSGNASVGGNLSVAGNSTVTGNQTVTGDAIFSDDVSVAKNLNVSGDTTITDDLYVNGSTHLKDVETDGSVDIDGTLRVTWAINGWNWMTITGQIESDTVRTGEIIADEARISEGLYLSQGAEAPDFVLQSEKNQPNGVAWLDANGKIDTSLLPNLFTSAWVKVGVGNFANSDTSTVVDADITADAAVLITNYQDIEWDTREIIWLGQITVISNQTETWSYKYVIVRPVSNETPAQNPEPSQNNEPANNG